MNCVCLQEWYWSEIAESKVHENRAMNCYRTNLNILLTFYERFLKSKYPFNS